MNDRELHFIAIGGAGMSGLALVCRRLGATVTGSDRAESSYLRRVRDAGIDARVGHDAESLPPTAEVVVSTAVPEDNPELAAARERGQRVIHRGELLAELCARKRLIAVAGTHGKTTTTGMVVHALRELGADPAFFIGGELPGAGEDGAAANAGWGEGEWVVAEADESDGSFLELRPEIAVVTNLELDHHSRWRSLAELHDAFAAFAEPAAALALGGGVDLEASRVVRFDAERPGPPLELTVPGRHNLLNARAALAALELAGFDLDRAAEALATFPGIHRRQELKGTTPPAPPSTTTTPTIRPRSRRRSRRSASSPRGASSPSSSRTSTRARRRSPSASAPRSPPPTRSASSTSTRRARSRSAISPGSAASTSPGRSPSARPAGRCSGCATRETARNVLPARLRADDLVVTIGAGDINQLAEDLVA